MATLNFFNPFKANVENAQLNLGSDQLAIALTDSAPVNTNAVIGDITQISYTNFTGSPSYLALTTTSSTQTSGTYNLKLSNPTYTATGTIPAFRYVVVYDQTTSKLICWYDTGSEQSVSGGGNFAITFDGTNGLYSKT